MSETPYQKPTGCIQARPTNISVFFAGAFINLAAISRLQGIEYTLLSHMFAGRRYPKVVLARKVAAALGMDTEEFYRAFDDHLMTLEAKANSYLDKYQTRIQKEREERAQTLASGRIPLSRLPGVYLPSDVR